MHGTSRIILFCNRVLENSDIDLVSVLVQALVTPTF